MSNLLRKAPCGWCPHSLRIRAAAARHISIDASSLKGKHLDNMFLLDAQEHKALLDCAAVLKRQLRGTGKVYRPLVGKTMSMIFQKRSTRTRVSAETGLTKLGGHPLFLGADDIQLGKNETLRDTANVLGRYNDIILARVFEHDTIVELCKHSSVPVINGLSDTHHPLQLLADAQTIREAFGTTEGLTIAWVGDGNNILHTFLSSAGPLGYNVRYACPAGYQPDASIVDRSTAAAKAAGVSIFGTHIPEEAVRGADVIVTDTWVSMGQETEAQKRLKDFAGYQVTHELAKRGGAKPGWKFLHCLPRKPQEVDDAVFYSDRSLVWQEAENRMWTFMAVALAQVQGGVDI